MPAQISNKSSASIYHKAYSNVTCIVKTAEDRFTDIDGLILEHG